MGLMTLVRHGQASFGTDDYDRLSALGKEQSATLGSFLRQAGRTPDLVVVGGMRRQRETHEALARAAGWQDVPVQQDSAWDEYDHEAIVAGAETPTPDGAGSASLQVTTRGDNAAFQHRLDAALALWTRADAADGPDGDGGRFGHETWARFRGRTHDGLTRVVAEAGSGRWVVVVSSAGPVSLTCARLAVPSPDGGDTLDEAAMQLWPSLNRVLVNSSQSRVVVGRSGVTMLSFNEHQHLAPAQVTNR